MRNKRQKLGFTPLEIKTNRKDKSLTGFTLIELLVVVAIIGLLSSVIIAALGQSRVKARDSRRLEDVQQIRSALELYSTQAGGYLDQSLWVDGASISCNGVSLFRIPYDPGVGYSYVYKHTGNSTTNNCGSAWSGYALGFATETTTDLGPPGDYCLRPVEGITGGQCP